MRFAVCLLTAAVLFGQPQNKKLTFDVVSIKPHKLGDLGGMVYAPPGGRYSATNVGLRQLILAAYVDYGLPVFGAEVTGLPEWAEKDRFDVEARPEPGFTPTKQQTMKMLQAMLEDRFKLRVRHESRDAPMYALRIDQGGLKMKPSAAIESRSCSGAAPAAGQKRFCAANPMTMLVVRLNGAAGRTVVDKTGLTGLFDIDLQWTPDPLTDGSLLAPGAGTDKGGPSLFTALREQLGLRLVAETGPADSFVVESVERPTEN